jgi:hypothetical protein
VGFDSPLGYQEITKIEDGSSGTKNKKNNN